MKQIITATLLGYLAVTGYAQTLTPTWTVALSERGYKVRTGPDGSVYTVSAPSSRPVSVSVDKYSPSGSHLWRTTYMNEPNVLTPVDMAIDSTGAAIVVTSNFQTEKISSAGAIVWSQNLSAPAGFTYSPFVVQIGTSDQIFIGALDAATGDSTGATALIIYPSSGATPSIQTWMSGEPSEDRPTAMAVVGEDAYMLVDSVVPGTETDTIYVTEFQSGGTSANWSNNFSYSSYGNLGYAITADSTGAYVTGSAVYGPTGEENLYMIVYKVNTSGALTWSKSYMAPEDLPFGMLQVGEAVALDGAGSVYVSGFGEYPPGSPGINVWKYNATSGAPYTTSGLLQTIPSTTASVVYSMAATSSLCAVMYGATTGYSSLGEVSPAGTILGTFLTTVDISCNLSAGSTGGIFTLTQSNLRRFN